MSDGTEQFSRRSIEQCIHCHWNLQTPVHILSHSASFNFGLHSCYFLCRDTWPVLSSEMCPNSISGDAAWLGRLTTRVDIGHSIAHNAAPLANPLHGANLIRGIKFLSRLGAFGFTRLSHLRWNFESGAVGSHVNQTLSPTMGPVLVDWPFILGKAPRCCYP